MSARGFVKKTRKVIRLARHGCANRPFYHIVVTNKYSLLHMPVVEQVGTHDPLPNSENETLTSLNFERIQYWIGKGAQITKPVADLLGLAGFFPIHPHTYMTAWRNREAAKSAAQQDGQTTMEEATK